VTFDGYTFWNFIYLLIGKLVKVVISCFVDDAQMSCLSDDVPIGLKLQLTLVSLYIHTI